MSIASQSTQQKFPFPYNNVFDSVIAVMPSIGFNIKSQGRVIGRITASTGMSLFSWGENVTIVVESVDASTALVAIESALKVGVNVAGGHRHTKNFNRLIQAVSFHLQSARPKPPPIPPASPIVASEPERHEYFRSINGTNSGPYTLREMRQFRKNGRIDDGTLIFREGESEWRPVGEFAEIVSEKPTDHFSP